MEIYNNKDKRFISVWMTNEKQKLYDRKKLTAQLLKDVDDPKCKVIFCLSGEGDLFEIACKSGKHIIKTAVSFSRLTAVIN